MIAPSSNARLPIWVIRVVFKSANDFRSTPLNGHRRIRLTRLKSAMCGRLRVGKSFFHVLQHWSVQPCVRPFDAVHMTAGHNALRGSGPDQQLAFKNAMAHVLIAGSTGSALRAARPLAVLMLW